MFGCKVPRNYSGEILYQYDLQSCNYDWNHLHMHIHMHIKRSLSVCLVSIPHIHILDRRCQVCTVTHSNSWKPQTRPFFICMSFWINVATDILSSKVLFFFLFFCFYIFCYKRPFVFSNIALTLSNECKMWNNLSLKWNHYLL